MSIDFSDFYKAVNTAYHEMISDTQRYHIVYGGSGSSKSYSICQDEIYKQIFFKGTNLLVVRQTSKSNRNSTFPLFLQVMSAMGVLHLFKPNKTDMTLTCTLNGNEIRFGGLDDVEKIKSITFSTGVLSRIWVEEASETKENDIDQLDLRLRGVSKVPFQLILSFNPISSLHWLKKRYFDFPQENTLVVHTTYKDNKWIDTQYKETLEKLKDTNRMFYDVYCLGKWGVIGNVVFDNWIAKPCPYSEEDFDEVFSGMDFGFNHPYAWEKLGLKDGELYSFDEVYVREKTNQEVIDIFNKEQCLSQRSESTADSAEPARIKEWVKNGYNVKPAKKGKDSVSRGIDFLKTMKWYIDPDKCPGLLSEVQTYSYKEDKFGQKTDEPINFKDDGIAAVRYALEKKSSSLGSKFFI